MKKILIDYVIRGSIAEEAGIEAGDYLISIQGREIKDIFDYQFMVAEDNFTIEIEKGSGELWEIEIEKDLDEDLGLVFNNGLMDLEKSCENKCIFCFVDQLPKGMRQTLYFKDDDTRLAFLFGNYVTLTNVSEDEMDRIIKYKFSPVNISVHTTNPKLRIKMLANLRAGDVLKKIKKLAEAGISINAQIVVCPEINDGQELDRTINDLVSFYPLMCSISIVPVGLTKYRDKLFKIKPHNADSAAEILLKIESWQKRLLDKHGSRIVFPADEFYILAGWEIPPINMYEDFPQLENGVGMIRLLLDEFNNEVKRFPRKSLKKKLTIATGLSIEPFIKSMAKKLEDRFNGLKIEVYGIKNNFFGDMITVTGLLTGKDIIAQLKGKDLGEALLLCETMFKADEDILLDDVSIKDLEKELNTNVYKVKNSGYSFIETVVKPRH